MPASHVGVTMKDNLVDEGKHQIDEWLKKTGMKESRLGLLACANPRAVANIRSEGATLKNFRKVLEYIEVNPDGE